MRFNPLARAALLGVCLLSASSAATATEDPMPTLADLANASAKLTLTVKELARVKASLPASAAGEDTARAYTQSALAGMPQTAQPVLVAPVVAPSTYVPQPQPITPPVPAPPAPGFAPASQGPVQIEGGVLSDKPPLPEGMQ